MLLGVDKYKLIGHLHELWWWALDNVPANGDLGDLTDEEIAAAAGWDGDANVFVKALTEAGGGGRPGFIEMRPDGRCLHDWWEYAGKLLERREKDRQRKREEAQGIKEEESPPADFPGNSDGTPAELQGNSIPTVPNRTLPNRTEPNPSNTCLPEATEAEREILNVLKSVPQYKFDYKRDLEHIRTLAVDYPSVDLLAEAKKWRAWRLDNPKRGYKNPRLAFRNWCEIAEKRLQERRMNGAAPRQHPAKPQSKRSSPYDVLLKPRAGNGAGSDGGRGPPV
jgi:hypothetical protein